MTKRFELPLKTVFGWYSLGQKDLMDTTMFFSLQFVYWLLEQGFLINPDPELNVMEIERRNDKLILRKVKENARENT
jgi:hypothetical protein